MGRSVAVVGLLMMVMACGGAGWRATRPPVGQFLVPGATEIQVTALRWNEWQINYRAVDIPTPWSTAVGRQLETDGWSSPDSVGYGALTRSYTRASSLGFCTLWEWAFLSFDPIRPHVAHNHERHALVEEKRCTTMTKIMEPYSGGQPSALRHRLELSMQISWLHEGSYAGWEDEIMLLPVILPVRRNLPNPVLIKRIQ